MANPYAPPESTFQGSPPAAPCHPPLWRRGAAAVADALGIALFAVPLLAGSALALPEGALENTPGLPVWLVVSLPGIAMLGRAEASGWHATPGKHLLGLQTLHEDGTPMSLQEALIRNLCKWLLLGLWGVLGLSVFSNPQRTGVWDRPFSTRTVWMGTPPNPAPNTPRNLS